MEHSPGVRYKIIRPNGPCKIGRYNYTAVQSQITKVLWTMSDRYPSDTCWLDIGPTSTRLIFLSGVFIRHATNAQCYMPIQKCPVLHAHNIHREGCVAIANYYFIMQKHENKHMHENTPKILRLFHEHFTQDLC